jgi:hypothetical protein
VPVTGSATIAVNWGDLLPGEVTTTAGRPLWRPCSRAKARADPPFCMPVAGPVRTLGHAQIRNSVGRLGHPEKTTPERTRAPWQKRDPRPRVLGSQQTRSFLASTRGVRLPRFLGDAAHQRVARVAEIGRWVAGSSLRYSVRLESACYETRVGPRVIQRSSAKELAERATAASSARLCLSDSMTSRQATTVAMSSRRPRRQ